MTLAVAGAMKQQVGLVREVDMCGFPAFLFVIQVGHDGMAGESLESERGDEAQGMGGHHDAHIEAFFGQLASSSSS